MSQVPDELQLHRLEHDLFRPEKGSLEDVLPEIEMKYGEFFRLYTQFIIGVGRPDEPNTLYQLKTFIADPDIAAVSEDVTSEYDDFTNVMKNLRKAFQYYRIHFPGKKVPAIVTYVSGYNYSITCSEEFLGIGLDMYMGSEYTAYKLLQIPSFKLQRMNASNIPRDAIKGWIESDYEISETQSDFLTHMIHNGKILYSIKALFPDGDESFVTGYTPAQLEWCEKNEKMIWSYFIEHNLLYSKNLTEFVKFISEGKSTSGFSPESPSMIGNWIGYQIVKRYMKELPETSLGGLMKISDAQIILSKSKYKPKK